MDGSFDAALKQLLDASDPDRVGWIDAVVRVWELQADVLMAGGLGATRLALPTDDAEPRLPQLVSRFADRVAGGAGATEAENLLLGRAYLLLGLRYDRAVAGTRFHGVQKMRESSTYQAILEEGRVEGALQTGRDNVLALIEERFGVVPPEVEARVRATTDPDALRNAFRQVLHVSTPGDLPL